jgi:uncharacterized protein
MTVWWNDGLPFACTQCGKCCHAHGEMDKVYVSYRDRTRLAEHFGVNLASFNRSYTRSEDSGHRSLRFVDGHCVFLEGTVCSVHAAKPTQCGTWPFWEELLVSEETYRQDVMDFCPGSNAEGPVVSAASIRQQMESTEEALD